MCTYIDKVNVMTALKNRKYYNNFLKQCVIPEVKNWIKGGTANSM